MNRTSSQKAEAALTVFDAWMKGFGLIPGKPLTMIDRLADTLSDEELDALKTITEKFNRVLTNA